MPPFLSISCVHVSSNWCSEWLFCCCRATHLFPHQSLGIVGQHDFSVECLDISHEGSIIASAAAAGGFVKFWNIKYIEETEVVREKKKKKKAKASQREHNLPSSQVRNTSDFFADLAGPS